MSMRFTNEWLRRRIERDADVDTEAGLPITKPEVLQAFISGKAPHTPPQARSAAAAEQREPVVLGTLLRQLRRRDNMDLARLASELRVAQDELRAIEKDRSFVPKPRTIHQLAVYYKISPRGLLRLSSAAAERDPDLDQAAVRFAASSDDLSKLSRSERKRLNDFVKILSEYKEGSEDNAE